MADNNTVNEDDLPWYRTQAGRLGIGIGTAILVIGHIMFFAGMPRREWHSIPYIWMLLFVIGGGAHILYLISTYIDNRRYNNFTHWWGPRRLPELGLHEDIIDNYRGYKGTYRNYFVRVYINQAYSNYGFPVYFVLYYRPFASERGTIDYRRLHYIADTYGPSSFWNDRTALFADAFFLEYRCKLDTWTFISTYKARIDGLVDIAEKEQLIPLTEDEADRMMALDTNTFVPSWGALHNLKRKQLNKQNAPGWQV